MTVTLRAIWTLASREVVRFYRQRSRVIGGLLPPVIFWAVIGTGLGGSFHAGGWSDGAAAAPAIGETSLQYLIPGTVALIVLFAAIFSTFSLIEDRHAGFLQAVLVAPVPRAAIVLGKMIGGATLAALQGGLFLAVAPALGAPLAWWSLPGLLAVVWLAAFALTGLGFVCAWHLDSMQGFHAVMNLVLMPLWLLSGALFPADGAPAWLQWVMRLDPLTYVVTALRRGLFPASTTGPSWNACLGVILLCGSLTVLLALHAAGRRTSPPLS